MIQAVRTHLCLSKALRRHPHSPACTCTRSAREGYSIPHSRRNEPRSRGLHTRQYLKGKRRNLISSISFSNHQNDHESEQNGKDIYCPPETRSLQLFL